MNHPTFDEFDFYCNWLDEEFHRTITHHTIPVETKRNPVQTSLIHTPKYLMVG